MPMAFFNSNKKTLDFYNKLDNNISILILLNNKYDMKNLAGFSSKEWPYSRCKYGNGVTIEWETTIMTPENITTVKDLFNLLKDTHNTSISICRDWNNSEFKNIENRNGLIQYFWERIKWIIYIENPEWAYYDVRIYDETIKALTIENTKSKLKHFQFKKFNLNIQMKLEDWSIDSGETYHIVPKRIATVNDLIYLINTIWDKDILISVDSEEENETTDFIKTSEIPDRFKKCKITGWTITFGKKGTYYAVSTWFDPNETENLG